VRHEESDDARRGLPVTLRSEELYARAAGLIPAATQTLAKGPGQFVRGVAPKYLARGKGARVFDVDGNEYLDYSMAVGPLSLGYCHPAVDDAIRAQLEDGITFSLMHPLEVEVAELVREVVPNAESVRYGKTGADATSAAVRLARAFTRREKVLCCGYHGWHDWFIATTDRSAGIPAAVFERSFTIPYGDADAARDAIDGETACVILEPVTFQAAPPGYLEALRAACDRAGALLVFDEMWTGFRLALGGAQQRFGVRADLACFSKAVANGMPLSLLTGRGDVMALLERQVFFFTTFGGEALSLAAARATIREIRDRDVPGHIARLGQRLKDGYNQIAAELGLAGKTSCVGYDCRTLVSFDASAGQPLELKSLVQQELLRRGILWQGFHNLSLAHGEEDVARTLAAYREVLGVLARAIENGDVRERLLGEPVEPVFRRTTHFDTRPAPAAARG
jgi:glutamate-1-semialdehyde aminotransferase